MTPPSPPGKGFQYSNSGYVLLARVIEVIAGEPYHKFQKRRIFDVLGMSNTADHHAFNGSGRIWTTLNDYAKWDAALWRQDGRLLSPAGYQMLWTTGATDDGEAVHYGFGWFLTPDASCVWHTGSGNGWKNGVHRLSQGSTTVAIFSKQNPQLGNLKPGNDAHAEILSVVKSLAVLTPPADLCSAGR